MSQDRTHLFRSRSREAMEPTPDTPTVTVRLPFTYAYDYQDRIGFGHIGKARVIKANKLFVYVELDHDAWSDLISDSGWYADEWGCPRWPENMTFIRSGTTAYKKLREAGDPGKA